MRPRPTEQANGEELARGKFCLDRPDLNTSVIAKVMPKRDHIHKFGWMQYSEALPALYSYTAVCDACNAQHTRSGVIWLLEVDDINVLEKSSIGSRQHVMWWAKGLVHDP